MQNRLKKEIKRVARRSIERQLALKKRAETFQNKFGKRTGLEPGTPAPREAEYPHRHFDPKYCLRNANFLAKTIWRKVLLGTYEPTPALNFFIPKKDGSYRSLMSFSFPDAALANIVLKSARNRNLKRLSSNSYAYHPRLNLFDAILALNSTIREEKVFAIEIDFEKYFDSIPTRHLLNCINDKKLLSLTPHERYIMKAFMRHRHAENLKYVEEEFARRSKGTPQGSSVSLLLANVANHGLDVALERQAGRFVRYADDVTALCSSYEEAQLVENTFHKHCRDTGIKIHPIKSKGISILNANGAELRNKGHFDYLGYRFEKHGLTVPDSVVKRIKSKLSNLMQIYLIQYPAKFDFNRTRAGIGYDWDLLGLIHETRGYLYGGLREKDLAALIHDGKKPPIMKGLMGFYALLEQQDKLRELDGWLVGNLSRCMKKRQTLLAGKYETHITVPSKTSLVLGDWLDPKKWTGPNLPEVGLPSFVRGWRAARKYYYTFGLEDVQPPSYHYYN